MAERKFDPDDPEYVHVPVIRSTPEGVIVLRGQIDDPQELFEQTEDWITPPWHGWGDDFGVFRWPSGKEHLVPLNWKIREGLSA